MVRPYEVATKERGDGSSDLRLDNGRGPERSPSGGVSGPITATHMFSSRVGNAVLLPLLEPAAAA